MTLHTGRVPPQLGIASRSTARGDAPTPSASRRPLTFLASVPAHACIR